MRSSNYLEMWLIMTLPGLLNKKRMWASNLDGIHDPIIAAKADYVSPVRYCPDELADGVIYRLCADGR